MILLAPFMQKYDTKRNRREIDALVIVQIRKRLIILDRKYQSVETAGRLKLWSERKKSRQKYWSIKILQ